VPESFTRRAGELTGAGAPCLFIKAKARLPVKRRRFCQGAQVDKLIGDCAETGMKFS
jgi:hypothetical protein